jgi:hypothetical protein
MPNTYFWKDLEFIIKTFFFRIIESMKKVLYIVARGKKQAGTTRAPVESQTQYEEAPSDTFTPTSPIAENPIPDPMVVSTREMERVDSTNCDDSDVVIRIDIPDGLGDHVTLQAAYHLAVMEKLNNISNGMDTIHERIENMALNLDALAAEVARVKVIE